MTIEELKKQHDFVGVCGLKKSTIDKRDYTLTYQTTQVTIPDEFRLEPPDVIKDQGQTPMCASFSSSYIAEHLNKLTNGKYIELSPSFVYANRPDQNSEGMELRDADKIIVNNGICKNELFDKIENEPQLNVDYNNSNPDSLVKDASNYKAVSFAQLSNVNDMKLSLMTNGFLHFGVPWYSSNSLNYIMLNDTDEYGKDGYVAQLIKGDDKDLEGYHAITAIGFTKKYDGFWCVNSWSDQYGNEGKFILPFDYPIDSCFTILGKTKEPSNANTIIPIIKKKSNNEIIQLMWKLINWILNKFIKHK